MINIYRFLMKMQTTPKNGTAGLEKESIENAGFIKM